MVQTREDLHSYLNELKEFLLKTRSEEEIRSSEFIPKTRELAQRGRELIREFKDEDVSDFKPFLRAMNDMIENIKNDELLQVLRHHAGIVKSDLSYVDSEGKEQVDTNMLTKLQTALLPFLVNALKYIPVTRIEKSDRDREFWLDNIVLCSYDLIPENLRFHMESYSKISLRDIEVKSSRTHLVIELDRLLTELKDVEFFYKMKNFPHLEERGRVTFRIKGDGANLTFNYSLEQGSHDLVPRLKDGYASFDVSDMEIVFDTASLKYPVLVPMLTGLFKLQIKQEIERQVEKNLTGFIDNLGSMITESLSQYNRPILSKIAEAKKTIKSSPIVQVFEQRREILE